MDDAMHPDAAQLDRPFAGARRLPTLASRVEAWVEVHEAVQECAEEQALGRPLGEGAWRAKDRMPRAALFSL